MQSSSFASRVSAATLAVAALFAGNDVARAADLPGIKISATNVVPACATPGRLQAYLSKRNATLDPQFTTIAVDYMREGDALGIRWDMAFFQMMLETGHLSYAKGSRITDGKPGQNNFAGLRPIEKNAGYETFPDVATGVRAHLQHVLLYSGATIAAPVAQRTQRLQEMGLLATWRKTIAHEVTFEDLAEKWTDGSRTYADRVEEIAKKFNAEFCDGPDPSPDMLAAARGTLPNTAGVTAAAAVAVPPTAPAPTPTKVSSAELVRRAIAEGTDERSGLGAGTGVGVAPVVKILNAPLPEAATPAPEATVAQAPAAKLPVPQLPRPKQAAELPKVTKTAAAGAAAKVLTPVQELPPARAPEAPLQLKEDAAAENRPAAAASQAGAVQKCRVFTASYGGQHAVIVRAVIDQTANFTVLDVNEGQETREAEAYIAAYAKGGAVTGQFATQDKALEKAFELCPEG